MWPFTRKKLTPQEEQIRQLRKAAKELGYEDIQSQYELEYNNCQRNGNHWSNHLHNTRHFITDCARRCNSKKTCVVIGSGHCFDVPILELSRMFEKVYLMDICHPLKARQKTSEFKNVEFITEDVTKIAIETINSISRYRDFSVDLLISSPNYSHGNYCDTLNDFDFVVSVNTLSFLAEPIINYLNQVKLIDDISSHSLESFVHQYHINLLPKGKSCIISPISEKYYKKYTNDNNKKNDDKTPKNDDELQMYDKSITFIPKEVIKNPQEWLWDYSNDENGRIEYGVKAWEY